VVLLKEKPLCLGRNAQEGEMEFCHFQGRCWLGIANVPGHGVRPGLFRFPLSGRTSRLLLGLAAPALGSCRLLLWPWRLARFREGVPETWANLSLALHSARPATSAFGRLRRRVGLHVSRKFGSFVNMEEGMARRKRVAGFPGTFWLVPGGCGSALPAAGFPQAGIGLPGVSLAFGLTVVAMACAIGHGSGCERLTCL